MAGYVVHHRKAMFYCMICNGYFNQGGIWNTWVCTESKKKWGRRCLIAMKFVGFMNCNDMIIVVACNLGEVEYLACNKV